MYLNVFIDGDKLGFNSKSAIDKFKTEIKNNTKININEINNKYIKSDYILTETFKNNTDIKFEIIKKIIIPNNDSNDNSKKELLRQKIKSIKNNRTSKITNTISDENIPPDIMKEYNKLLKISHMPTSVQIPNPSEILSDPEKYKPLISMVLNNKMIKQFGASHPYIKYFKLLSEKINNNNNIENIENIEKIDDIANIVGKDLNDNDTESETDDNNNNDDNGDNNDNNDNNNVDDNNNDNIKNDNDNDDNDNDIKNNNDNDNDIKNNNDNDDNDFEIV
jgi:hypothetical protein